MPQKFQFPCKQIKEKFNYRQAKMEKIFIHDMGNIMMSSQRWEDININNKLLLSWDNSSPSFSLSRILSAYFSKFVFQIDFFKEGSPAMIKLCKLLNVCKFFPRLIVIKIFSISHSPFRPRATETFMHR